MTAWRGELDIEVLGIELLRGEGPGPLEVRELCVLALASAGIERRSHGGRVRR